MVEFTYPEIEYRVAWIANQMQIDEKVFSNVYGVPMGGVPVAVLFAKHLDIPVLLDLNEATADTLIVDDLIDSGATMEKLKILVKGATTAVIFDKGKGSYQADYCHDVLDEWIKFPWEKGEAIEENIKRIFQYIGEDPNRPGLLDTPKRMAKMWMTDIFAGYDPEKKPKITTFENGEDGVVYDTMVCDSGDFYSNCEHHMLPFFGKYAFAYIPSEKGKILGLSKVARVVDYCASRMQIQERLGKDIIDMIEEELGDIQGIAIAMEAEHLCKSMRGVKKKGTMRTVLVRGLFKSDPSTRHEFLNYVDNIFPRQK